MNDSSDETAGPSEQMDIAEEIEPAIKPVKIKQPVNRKREKTGNQKSVPVRRKKEKMEID